MDRTEFLIRNLDKATMKGIEIGPFYAPVAPKSGGWNTIVVDFTDGSGLRDISRGHTSSDIRERTHLIEDVDIVWRNNRLDEACLSIHPDGYDYVIASHVVEHLPDFIGFFRQMAKVLKPEGIISLALPDMRYCFDFFKPLSMTNHALDAAREGRSRHSASTVFGANAYQGWVEGQGAWGRGPRGSVHLVGSLTYAYQLFKKEATVGVEEPYIDAHAWIFTPSSFSLMILELNFLGEIDFYLDDIQDGPASEFLAKLKRGRIVKSEEELLDVRQDLIRSMVVERALALPDAVIS